MKNVIVGQSGGPTAAINASLVGVYETAKTLGFDTVYGMQYGIEGLLDELYVDLSVQIKNSLDVELLKRTPPLFWEAAVISCLKLGQTTPCTKNFLHCWKNWKSPALFISAATTAWIPSAK